MLSAILMVMLAHAVVIGLSGYDPQPLLAILTLVGIPALGALVGDFLKFQGPGGRFFGVTLGIFVSIKFSVALSFYLIYQSID